MSTASSSSPSVSVVLCTYNGGLYLREQLESILGQTHPPSEIIVSDDGSTDATVAILDEFAPRARRANVVWRFIRRESPLGAAENFWRAIPEASGDLVALADQDDVWRPDKLEILGGHFLHDRQVSLVHTDAELIDQAARPLGSLFDALRVTARERSLLRSGRGFSALVRRNLVTGATAIFTKDLAIRAGGLPAGWMHDEWLGLHAAATGSLVWDPRRLVSYRQHGRNEIGARKSGLSDAVARLREDRGVFLALRRERIAGFEELAKSASPGLDSVALEVLRGKIAHERMRVELPETRWRRLGVIVLALLKGGYSRYSRGVFDAVRDALLRSVA